jgi:hypothetical protein
MLSRARKAHNPGHQRVVATVSPPATLGKQLIKTMRRTLPPALGHLQAQSPKTRRRHRHQQPRLALSALSKINESLSYDLMAREIIRNTPHQRILGDA